MSQQPVSKTRPYRILMGMRSRCYNPNDAHYKTYGLKGIGICDEWQGKSGAVNFCEWAKEHGYQENSTIDRVDNSKGYSPQNCVWIPNYVNTSGNNLVVKLFYIIHKVPTFEVEYLSQIINDVENPADREYLQNEAKAADRKHKRKRLAKEKVLGE